MARQEVLVKTSGINETKSTKSFGTSCLRIPKGLGHEGQLGQNGEGQWFQQFACPTPCPRPGRFGTGDHVSDIFPSADLVGAVDEGVVSPLVSDGGFRAMARIDSEIVAERQDIGLD